MALAVVVRAITASGALGTFATISAVVRLSFGRLPKKRTPAREFFFLSGFHVKHVSVAHSEWVKKVVVEMVYFVSVFHLYFSFEYCPRA